MKQLKDALESMYPKKLWYFFFLLTQIPRPSKHEEQVRNFLIKFAEERNLEYDFDATGNVLIRKNATAGMENHQTVILQNHVDMVPEKNKDVEHDFEKDPIIAYVDNGWVKAKGTTLGGDNGIGAAAALTILDSNDISHGPIEALFTVDEETGLTGASNIDLKLKGKILLNLDTEDVEEFTVSCAGGIDVAARFNYSTEFSYAKGKKLTAKLIRVSGLKGGHSAGDINSGRGNAIKIMARILLELMDTTTLNLHSMKGGTKRNAIPRESEAIVVIQPGDEENFINSINAITDTIKSELYTADSGLCIQHETCETPDLVMSNVDQLRKIIHSINVCFNGVYRMNDEIPDLVETSNNLAKISFEEGKIEILCMSRSSVPSARDYIVSQISSAFKLADGKIETSGAYSGWITSGKSEILKVMTDLYSSRFSQLPKIKGTHGGLECGILLGKYPGVDAVSFGPTIKNAHSPDEMADITSVGKFFDFLIDVLENIPTNGN